MDHDRDARGVKRWGVVGSAVGGVVGLVLGVGGALSGDGLASLWGVPAFAGLLGACAIFLRARVEFAPSEAGALPRGDRHRHIGRHVIPGLVLAAVGLACLSLGSSAGP